MNGKDQEVKQPAPKQTFVDTLKVQLAQAEDSVVRLKHAIKLCEENPAIEELRQLLG